MQPMMPPPSAGPVGPVEPAKPKGRLAMVLGALLLVGGIVLGIVLAVTGVVNVSKAVDDMQRVPAPGTGTVEIAETGTYHLFYERPVGLVDDPYLDFEPSQVAIVAPSGAQLAIVVDSNSTTTYDFGDHHGRSFGTFRADETGTYRFRIRAIDRGEGDQFSFGPTGHVAVGRNSPLRELGLLLAGVFGGGALVLTGIVLLIVGGVRRSRSKQAAYVAAGVPGWGGPPAGGWSPPGPQPWTPPGAPQPWNAPGAPPAPQPWSPPGPQPWTPPGGGDPAPAPQPWTPPAPVDPPPPPGWVPPPTPPAEPSGWPGSSDGPVA